MHAVIADPKAFCRRYRATAWAACSAGGRVGLDRKTVMLNLVDSQTGLGRKMRPGAEDAQINGGVGGQLTLRPVEMAIVRA